MEVEITNSAGLVFIYAATEKGQAAVLSLLLAPILQVMIRVGISNQSWCGAHRWLTCGVM